MISYSRALKLLLDAADAAGPLAEETVPLALAPGRVSAARLLSTEELPRFSNSAMDGYAVRAADARRGRALAVAFTLAAGDAPARLARGRACEIMTGAPLPAGADAVVPVESTHRVNGSVELIAPCRPGDFVRAAGSDVRRGEALVEAGVLLEPKHLLALAAVGAVKIPVRRPARVAVLATGRELVAPERSPGPGQVRDASSTHLLAALRRAGCEARFHGIVEDSPARFRRRLRSILASAPDVVLTTGAVSMGRRDFVASELAALGAELLFHKVAVKPGKPILAARLRGALVVGLPGNPVSTAVGLRFFVLPYLRRRLGLPAERPERVRLSAAAAKPAGLRCFLKARREGQRARALAGQGSHQLKALARADAWAVLPEKPARLPAGAEVDVYPL